jgi:ribonuclease BN (tRNA processing enzyme)
MDVRILASSFVGDTQLQYASSYLINGSVAIDAGPLGFWGTPQEQERIHHIFLTHSHIDHIATLPIFIENVFDPNTEAVVLHGHPATLSVLREHIFNDLVWPDFVRLSTPRRPFMVLDELKPEVPVVVDGLSILPVAVDHVVPTFGYIVSDGRSTVIFGSDSHATSRIWHLAAESPEPRSAFVEATFPNSMRWLADASLHMTAEMLGEEVLKMPRMKRVLAMHLKGRFHEIVEKELRELNLPQLEIAVIEKTYSL